MHRAVGVPVLWLARRRKPRLSVTAVARQIHAVLTKIQWQFYDSPTRAVIMGLGLG